MEAFTEFLTERVARFRDEKNLVHIRNIKVSVEECFYAKFREFEGKLNCNQYMNWLNPKFTEHFLEDVADQKLVELQRLTFFCSRRNYEESNDGDDSTQDFLSLQEALALFYGQGRTFHQNGRNFFENFYSQIQKDRASAKVRKGEFKVIPDLAYDLDQVINQTEAKDENQ